MTCDEDKDDSRFEQAERKGYADKIQNFLKRAVSDGGVLVVCGPRGVGKSRLVDQALNGDSRGALSRLASIGCSRHRLRVMRAPRRICRDVVKVDVDPYFPHWSAAPEKSKDADSAAVAPYQVVVNAVAGSDKKKHPTPIEALLNNLIIALTGTLDPHHSVRGYGRTLRERLGFFRYWFSPAALAFSLSGDKECPDCWDWRLLWMLYLGELMVFCAAFLATPFVSHQQPLCELIELARSPITYVTPVAAWCWLRYLDWRALERIAHSLFNLGHAEKSSQSESQKTEWGVDFKRNGNLAAGLTAALAGFVGLAVLDSQNIPKMVTTGLLALGTGTVAFHYWRRSTEGSSARFGNDNINWKIALLRQYLFHMHRCGVEPVLVVDELDKLESDNQSICDETSTPGKGEKPLNDFLGAMLRVKHSLGADFFWVLVGGAGLYECIAYARQANAELGVRPLATLSQRELMLGPVGLDAARQFLENRKLPGDFHALTWLSAQGTYSNLRRLTEEMTVGFSDAKKKTADEIANRLNGVWAPNKMEGIARETNPEFYVDRNLVYLRMGMLAFGLEVWRGSEVPADSLAATLAQALKDSGIADPGEVPIGKALSLGSPTVLWHLGRLLAYFAVNAAQAPQQT